MTKEQEVYVDAKETVRKMLANQGFYRESFFNLLVDTLIDFYERNSKRDTEEKTL